MFKLTGPYIAEGDAARARKDWPAADPARSGALRQTELQNALLRDMAQTFAQGHHAEFATCSRCFGDGRTDPQLISHDQ